MFILSKYSEANVETRRVVVYSCFDKGEDPEIPFPYGNPSKTLRVNVECILPFYFVRREENVGQLQIVTGLYTTVRAIKEQREIASWIALSFAESWGLGAHHAVVTECHPQGA